MAERGIKVDHSTLNRWVVYYASKLEKAFHQKKKQPGSRWRLDETYNKGIRLISYSPQSVIPKLRRVSLTNPSAVMVSLA